MCDCRNSNKSILKGKGAMPIHPTPSSSNGFFSRNRYAYSRIVKKPSDVKLPVPRSCGSINGFNKVGDSSTRTMMKRINAVGKTTVNVNGGNISFSNVNRNTVNSALSRVRGGGTVSPKKKVIC
jgi:hypothetical protein